MWYCINHLPIYKTAFIFMTITTIYLTGCFLKKEVSKLILYKIHLSKIHFIKMLDSTSWRHFYFKKCNIHHGQSANATKRRPF